jgi:transketolase
MMLRERPYEAVLKPYGAALVELAEREPRVLCLTGDLTRQCEIDLFQARFADRFIHAGMAEANMVGIAAALARSGFQPFVHTFGVFATRRAIDQIINAVAYPQLPVRLIGFMPGVSSPGGPSHQAIDDVGLMRVIPGMTVIDVADAVETRLAVSLINDIPGPVYMRLKRGEIPVVFGDDHELLLDRATVLSRGSDVAIVASGMMLAAAIHARDVLEMHGVSVALVNAAVIKPFDAATVVEVARGVRAVVTAENHSVIGGLGSAAAEALAEHAVGVPLRRVGLRDTFAEGAASARFLFHKYGLSTQHLVDACWRVLACDGETPRVDEIPERPGSYSPV